MIKPAYCALAFLDSRDRLIAKVVDMERNLDDLKIQISTFNTDLTDLGATAKSSECEKNIKGRLDYRRHVRKYHSHLATKNCHDCDEKFYSVCDLRKHTKDIHIDRTNLNTLADNTDLDDGLDDIMEGGTQVEEVTKERLDRTEAGERLDRKKDGNQNHGARDKFCLISKRLHRHKMAENTRLRDKNDKKDDLYEFWRQNYVKNDSCFMQERSKKNKITLYWKLVYLCWWKERQKILYRGYKQRSFTDIQTIHRWVKMDQKNGSEKQTWEKYLHPRARKCLAIVMTLFT